MSYFSVYPASLVLTLCALSTLSTSGASVAADSKPVPATRAAFVSVDMPHGGCRLVVESDGAARLEFGAAARYVNVRQGTFDLLAVRASLRKLVLPEETRLSLSPPVGGVVFSDDGVVLPFTDQVFAKHLFQQAWENRAAPVDAVERRYQRELYRFCKLH